MDLNKLITLAYQEDIPNTDITTDSLKIESLIGKAHLVAKEDLVLSGIEIFEACLQHIDPELKIKTYFKNSDVILNQQSIALIEGNMIALLKAERVALNFLGHLTGIASLTSCFVKTIEDSNCKILDTRKTTPLYRDLEKQAVRDGGASNHRRDLSSAILIKENHIQVAGSIEKALRSAKETNADFIEIELKNEKEIKIALPFEPTRILLDNMNIAQLKKAVSIIPRSIETEASGNMTLDRVKEVAETGVNFISVGAITHSAPTADISLLFDW